MSKYLRIDLESNTIAPSAYLVIRVMLLDSSNPEYLVDATNMCSINTYNGNAVLYNSINLGRPLIYGVRNGPDTINVSYDTYSESANITVDSNWDFNISNSIPLESDVFTSPYSKVSGYNKGRKRVEHDEEHDDHSDVMGDHTEDRNKPNNIGVNPDRIIMKQTFDATTIWTTKSTGYGRWYGRKFGVVEELDKLQID